MLVVFYQAHVPGWLQHRQVRTGNVVAHAATRLWFAHGIAVPGNYKSGHHYGFKRRCRVVAQHAQHPASQRRWPSLHP